MTAVGLKFPILDSSGNPTSTIVDMGDMFVPKDYFLDTGLMTWGYNFYGPLGIGSTIKYSSPVQVGSLSTWKYVCPGTGYMLGIKIDGTLWAWGYNASGQLGNGVSVNYSSPVQVGSLTNWQEISASPTHSAAIKTDGTLWTWGVNSYGQLGNGTVSISYSSPVQVGALTDWKQVSAGNGITLARKTDGTLWAIGFNSYGALGNETTNHYSSPIQVGALTNWKQISAGDVAVLAIKTDGTLWAWGINSYGQLGNGTVGISYSSPVQVGSLTNWKQCSHGSVVSSAIKTDGTLWCWGAGNSSQLGIGVSVSYSSPVQVGSLTNWKQTKTGVYCTLAIKTDGTLWGYGLNPYGDLGNNTTAAYTSPVQIGSLTSWRHASVYESSTGITSSDLP